MSKRSTECLTISDLIRELQKAEEEFGGDVPVLIDTEARCYQCHMVETHWAGMPFPKDQWKEVFGDEIEPHFVITLDTSCGRLHR